MRSPTAALAVLALLAAAEAPAAPEGGDRPRIGVLFWHDSPNDAAAYDGALEGLALAGIRPIYEVVRAGGVDEAARAALRDFEKRGVDLVYALGTGAALRARDEVKRVPVVFTAVTDPVGSGVVASLDGSGRNLCGTASGVDPADTLRVFRTALPGLRTLAAVHDPANPVSRGEVEAMRKAAEAVDPPLRLQVKAVDAAGLKAPDGVRAAATAALAGTDALWIPIDIEVYSRADQAAAAAAAARRPVLATAPAASLTAASVCVTVDFRAVGRSSAVAALRALRGEDPGRIPVSRPKSYRVILNLEAARRSAFEIPLPLLAAADNFVGVAGGR